MKYVIGIDNGSQSTKVSIYDVTGKEICYGNHYLKATATPEPGVVLHPDDDLWDSVKGGLKNCLAKFEGDVNDIIAIGLCTIRCCRALLREDGSLYMPVLSWMDARLAKPYEHEDDDVKYVTTTSGYLANRLTGEFKDTSANQEVYWPLDWNTLEWSEDEEVIKANGVRRDQLFELVKPGEEMGKLKADVAEFVGLPAGIPVVASANDKAVEVLGSGVRDENTIMISLGTFISAMQFRNEYFEGAQNFFPTLACIPHKYVYETNGIRRGMWTVSWFKSVIGEELVNCSNDLGISEEEYLNRMAEKVNPGSDGLITMLDWLASPSIPYRKGIMIGFDQRHTKYHMYRSIIEAIAFNIKNNIDLMLEETNGHIDEIVVIGGGSRSNVLMQIIADLFGKPVVRRVSSSSACLGAAICACIAVGEYKSFDEAVDQMVETKDRFEPNMQLHPFYNKINDEVVKKVRDHTDEILKVSYPIFQ
ncbi:MAG: FGGY-family carbohydrate kinase [Mycoplasmatales bacterium]